MKKSSNDTFFCSKRGIGWKDHHLSEIRQCLYLQPHYANGIFSWATKLKGKHFRHPIAVMGVVDAFEQWIHSNKDVFTLKSWQLERQNVSESKKEPQIPRLNGPQLQTITNMQTNKPNETFSTLSHSQLQSIPQLIFWSLSQIRSLCLLGEGWWQILGLSKHWWVSSTPFSFPFYLPVLLK